MSTDTWDFEIKVYDINRGFQLNSLKGENLTSKEMYDYIEKNIDSSVQPLRGWSQITLDSVPILGTVIEI